MSQEDYDSWLILLSIILMVGVFTACFFEYMRPFQPGVVIWLKITCVIVTISCAALVFFMFALPLIINISG